MDDELKKFFIMYDGPDENLRSVSYDVGIYVLEEIENISESILGETCRDFLGDMLLFAYFHGLCDNDFLITDYSELFKTATDETKWCDEYLFYTL